MGLLSEIRNPRSAIRQWFTDHLDQRAVREFQRYKNGLLDLASRPLLPVPGSNKALVGTAFDLGFRWLLGPLDAARTERGAAWCARAWAWPEVTGLPTAIIDYGTIDATLTNRVCCCLLLAHFVDWSMTRWLGESIPLPDAWAPFRGAPVTIETLLGLGEALDPADIADLTQLLAPVPDFWGSDLQQPAICDPEFAGGQWFGGARGDWILGDTLYECKCIAPSTSPGHRSLFSLEILLQGLSYPLLDTDDAYHLRFLSWYYPRQRKAELHNLRDLCRRLLGTEDVAELRQSLDHALRQARLVPDEDACAHLQQVLDSVFSGPSQKPRMRDLKITPIFFAGFKGLRAPTGEIPLPQGGLTTVTAHLGNWSCDLGVIYATDATTLLWAPILKPPKVIDDSLVITAAPAPLTPDSPLGRWLINALITQLDQR